MSGFAGFANFKTEIKNSKEILKNMSYELNGDKNNNANYYLNKNINFYQSTFLNTAVITHSYGEYSIAMYGEVYNKKELKKQLLEKNVEFKTNETQEILLKAYIHYGAEVVNYLNGAFSFVIWNSCKKELFLARDHFGLKPLFYTIKNGCLIFSTEIKALLEYPEVDKILDTQGVCELLGIGPAHTSGNTVFKNIYELKPAHFAIFNYYGLHTTQYWKLKSRDHKDSFGVTCEKIKYLLKDSIEKQLSTFPEDSESEGGQNQPNKICTFLSGGLDSSIITKYASDYYQKEGLGVLDTYSVDYVDNDKNFVKSDFQPNSDNYYIDLMLKETICNHHNVVIDTPELEAALEDAMSARNVPGMADIDSSLLLFCKNVKKDKNIALTGECSDEIFAGYPWFFREDALKSNTFPWSIAIDERQKMLKNELSKKIDLKNYIDYRYNESLAQVETLSTDSPETAEKRKISYLTLNWFMQTLLERSEKMALYSNFEIRVPFCDYRIAEYVWNIPWEFKALKGREKGLLRYVCRDLLPAEIIDRKKSPYPKTHNPTYLMKVKEHLDGIIQDKNAPINELLNKEFITEILKTDGQMFKKPLFGQLMTGPQVMAYIIQINMWLEKYQPIIEL